jgi:phosphate transport system permease protein
MLGDSLAWLAASGVAVCLLAMIGIVGLLSWQGFGAFWPHPVERIVFNDQSSTTAMYAQVIDRQGAALIVRSSELAGFAQGYRRIALSAIIERTRPPDGLAIELGDGRFLYARSDDIAQLRAAIAGGQSTSVMMDNGTTHILAAGTVRELLAPNTLSFGQKVSTFGARAWQFLSAEPSLSNLSGGVLPALVGTVTLVLLMSILVMPFGILAALYLHEMARNSWRTRLLRTAVNNLAGVPSIVYGIFGLGLFVHQIGGSLDRLLYADRLPTPTFGSGGLLWSALTLALLTLPVVIVATEEGLARIPRSLREGSLALGATRAETLWRLLLPMVRPAILTGLILATARAAGEVAPLMLVGVVKLAPALPLDGSFPYLHPTRQFMHLGYQVYDAALQGADAWRGVPRAYAGALLLLIVVVALNLSAIVVRNRLRERYRTLSV